jgi:hypothetical protein
MDVARREKLVLPPELAGRVALHSERNMRRALLSLEVGARKFPKFFSAFPLRAPKNPTEFRKIRPNPQ